MCCKGCKQEFNVKNFGFINVSAKAFQRLQWSSNVWLFFAYRLFMMMYVVTWMIFGYVFELEDNFWQFYTYWGEGVMVVYFVYAFILSIHAVVDRRQKENEEQPLRWFHKLHWVLFSTASTAQFVLTAFFWIGLAPTRNPEENLNPISFHLHAVNSILFLLEIFMVSFPTRFLHFIYPVLFGLVYGVFVLILNFTGINRSIYEVIDFEQNFGLAIGILLGNIFVLTLILHSMAFVLYLLRKFISAKTQNEDQTTGFHA